MLQESKSMTIRHSLHAKGVSAGKRDSDIWEHILETFGNFTLNSELLDEECLDDSSAFFHDGLELQPPLRLEKLTRIRAKASG